MLPLIPPNFYEYKKERRQKTQEMFSWSHICWNEGFLYSVKFTDSIASLIKKSKTTKHKPV